VAAGKNVAKRLRCLATVRIENAGFYCHLRVFRHMMSLKCREDAVAKARLITVVIEATDAGLLRATSPDFSGLHVAGHTVEAIKDNVKLVLQELLLARGESASVYETEGSNSGLPSPWVIVPKNQMANHC